MLVTIYKNCKLNNKYKDVFYNKTYLEGYLATLTSRIIVNDSEIFSRNNDSLYVDGINIQDFKQYNFLKIEDSIGVFYAFINNIEWINEVYVIHYEEDILSNYFEQVHIRNSLLTANKSLKLDKGNNQRNINYFTVPIESKSNDYLSIYKYNIDENTKPKICVLIKLQFYALDQAYKVKNRYCKIGLITVEDTFDTINIEDLNSTNKSLLDKFISDIINKRGITSFQYDFGDGSDTFYYDIDKIYAIPQDIIAFSTEDKISLFQVSNYQDYNIPANSYFIFNELSQNDIGYLGSKLYYIPYDRKIDSVGLFSKPIKVVNNGTTINVKFSIYSKNYGLSIILQMQSKIIDITEDFSVDMPFTQASSSELQLQRLQINLQENNLNNKIDNINEEINKNKLDIASNVIGGFTGIVGNALSGNFLGSVNSATNALLNTGKKLNDITENENDIRYATERISMINRKIYASSSLLNNKFSYNNALCGLCIFYVIEDNTQQINQAIALNGYNVRELVNDVIQNLDTEHLTDHYEVFKFDEVNLYGVIAQDYLRIIERVLLNGVRVWCQNDIGELI